MQKVEKWVEKDDLKVFQPVSSCVSTQKLIEIHNEPL